MQDEFAEIRLLSDRDLVLAKVGVDKVCETIEIAEITSQHSCLFVCFARAIETDRESSREVGD